MRQSRVLASAILFIATVAAACGSDSPTAPDNNNPGGGTITGTNCSVIVGNQGTVTARVDGTTFSGIVPGGGGTRTAVTLVLFGQSNDNTTLTIGILNPAVGVHAIGGLTGNTMLIQTRSCSAGTGLWSAIAAGSGSVTISTLTATGATGTFTGTLVAQAGSGATGNKVVTDGTFNLTF